jgi:hypothetical protein
LQRETNDIKGLEIALRNKVDSDRQRPEISAEVLDVIMGFSGIEATSVSYDGAAFTVNVNARCSTPTQVSDYIAMLRRHPRIENATYDGFTGSVGNITFRTRVTLARPRIEESSESGQNDETEVTE